MPITPVTTIDSLHPDPDVIRLVAGLLRSGKLVAFPTETVYGLGASALDSAAVARVFAAKGRPASNPVIVHIANESQMEDVGVWSPLARTLAAAFWPGPLTLVVPKSERIPSIVTAGGLTVAVRQPVHPVAAALVAEAGVPVAAPSANASGELSPTTAEHVLKSLDCKIDLVLDGGACPGGLESTVADVTGPTVRILRPGPITAAQLEAIVGRVDDSTSVPVDTPLPSPGMLTKHYAPRTALECTATEEEAEFLVRLYETAGLRVARLPLAGTPAAVAARLYADLHALDDAGFDRIIAILPPDTDEWQAIRDRLTRAAAVE